MSKDYVIPVLLTSPAESYQKALEQASDIVDGLNTDAGIGMEVEVNFEHDNIGQRVLYLHPEEDPDYEHTEDEDEDEDDN
jgi:hypothetical protein